VHLDRCASFGVAAVACAQFFAPLYATHTVHADFCAWSVDQRRIAASTTTANTVKRVAGFISLSGIRDLV
jgi:hypothetical protein